MTPLRSLDELAMFGGSPEFPEPLHVGRPNIVATDDFHRRVALSLERAQLSNFGPLVGEFERLIGHTLGEANVVSTSSATAGLELVFRDLFTRSGPGEVILPSFTFVAGAQAIANAGLKPRFVDVVPHRPEDAVSAYAAAIGAETRALLGVHLWGWSADVYGLQRLATNSGLALYFDAAHAMGVPLTGLGEASVFSFHATKVVHSFEGGAIATRDVKLAERLRRASNFGFMDLDTVTGRGTNAKLSEAHAAMGITSLEHLHALTTANRSRAEAWWAAVLDLPGVSVRSPPPPTTTNHHYFVVQLDCTKAPISRDLLLTALRAEGVLARRYFWPGCHRTFPFQTPGLTLDATERLAAEVLCLPTGTAITPMDFVKATTLFRWLLTHGEEITHRASTG